MTIAELKEQEIENYNTVVIEEGTRFEDATEIAEQEVEDTDIARDWVILHEDEQPELHILVQPKKEVPYIHIGAPAPNYAINSISTLRSYITTAAINEGVYEREENDRQGSCDIILSIDATDEQIANVFKNASQAMMDDGTVTEGSFDYNSNSATGLLYDAATASAEKTEPTRNW